MDQKFFFEKIPSFIIIFLPAFLITGPFLSDLGISLMAILFIINSFKNNLSKYYRNIYFNFFLIFWVILIVSSLSSEEILLSFKTSFFYFRFGIFSLCFWYLIDRNEKILNYFFYSILICFVCLIVDGYFQYIFEKNLLGMKLDNDRVSSFFGTELIMGSYIARLFPILFGLFIFIDQKSKIKSNKILFILTLVFIMSETLILLSGERTALFLMNMSVIFILLTIKNYKFYRFWTYIISLMLMVLIVIFSSTVSSRMVNQTINDLTKSKLKNEAKLENERKIYIFSQAHNDLYVTAINIFNDNKFFGVGPRQFRNVCNKYYFSEYSCQTHPHNTYIELLSEAGIFAFLIVFLLFVIILVFSIYHLYNSIFKKKVIYSDFKLCLLSVFLVNLWPIIPTGSFFNNWMSIVYYLPVGIYLWDNFKHKGRQIY